MDLDDKPAKKTARNMMAMTAAINKDSFRGQLQVTCYSCHRGSTRPVNVPPVIESDAPPRAVPAIGPPAGAAALDAEFYLALRLKEIFTQLRRGRPEEIAGVPCETLIGTGPGRPPVRLYFDSNSGLLLRMVRYAETPLGRNPTQIDYADYRAVDGVKIPFRWTLARPNGRFTIQISDAKTNVPVDDARFTRPAADVK